MTNLTTGHGEYPPDDVDTPTMVTHTPEFATRKVVSVGCGQYRTLALCSDGTLWVAGQGSNEVLVYFSKILDNVKSFACSLHFVVE